MRIAILVVLSSFLVACGGKQTGSAPTTLAPDAMTEAQKAQMAKGEAACNELMKKLVGRLMGAMQSDGTVGAIAVCKDAAPSITAEVSESHGVLIGRTSHRLRNPKNKPPAWAEEAVKRREEQRTWFALPKDRVGGLLPIRAMGLCSSCHGDPNAMEPAVREAITANYPDDRATGFYSGDLRGWFWVDVPPQK